MNLLAPTFAKFHRLIQTWALDPFRVMVFVSLLVGSQQAPLLAGADRPPQFSKTEHKLRVVVGNEVRSRFPEAMDPDGAPLTYQIESLPPGLSFNPLTRIIEGRPNNAGRFKCEYVAKNANGESSRLPVAISLMPIDDGGGSTLEPNYIEITNPSGPISVYTGQSVSFGAISDGGRTPKWTFGDGTYATGFTATHAFQAIGTYSVRFNVLSDGYYTGGSATVAITVSTPPPVSAITSVTASPFSASIIKNGSQTFAATVSGTGSYSSAVTWTVISGVGSINSVTGVYTSSAAGSATVKATSTQDGAKYGTATVTVNASTITGVSTNVSTAIVPRGGAQSFTAWVQGGTSNLIWTATGGSLSASQTTSGVALNWTAPTASGTYTLKATAMGDSSKFANIFVSVPLSGLAWKRDIIYMGTKEVAEIDKDGTHVTLTDHLGSPRFEVRANGQVVEQKFAPFGESLTDPGTMAKFAKGFTNHEQTDPSGLIYMQARFYLPMYHRFASPDPARDQHFEETQSWNIYSYVQNQPTMRIDPTGMVGVIDWNGLWNKVKSAFGGGSGSKSAGSGQQKAATADKKAGDKKTSGHSEAASTPGRKIWVSPTPDGGTAQGKLVGDGNGGYKGQCVSLAKNQTGIPSTSTWHQGEAVQGNSDIKPGTVIAAMKNGADWKDGGHVGLYVSQDPKTGLKMTDQFVTKGDHSVATRTYSWEGHGDHPSIQSQGAKYHVVETGK